MNINTLEFIHELLRAEVTRADEVYRAARHLQHEYEEGDDPNSELWKKQPTSAWQFLFVPAMRWKTSRRRSGKVTTEE